MIPEFVYTQVIQSAHVNCPTRSAIHGTALRSLKILSLNNCSQKRYGNTENQQNSQCKDVSAAMCCAKETEGRLKRLDSTNHNHTNGIED